MICDESDTVGADEAANLIVNGIDGGLLRFVLSDWLRASWFRDQGKLLRQLQAQALYQLLMLFLESPPVRSDPHSAPNYDTEHRSWFNEIWWLHLNWKSSCPEEN